MNEQVNTPMGGKMTLEEFLNAGFDFRYNVVTGVVEGKFKTETEFKRIEDFQLNSIVRGCRNAGFSVNTTNLDNLLKSNFVPRYNPFEDYFNQLPAWEGGIDYIDMLAQTVTTTNDPLWRTAFKKWFVAMIASILEDRIINHTVIVLSGSQGLGKTTWILKLVPEQLHQYTFSGVINPNNKDTLVLMSECMLINLDELENLNRKDLGSVKELITKAEIKLRRPYGRVNELMPRRASFAGSVNTVNFLNDTTGSRRFLCFAVTNINYNHGVDLNMAYSQALALYKSGFRYWFNKDEIEQINQNNESFRFISAEEELLLTYFEPCGKDEADCLLTATEILAELQGRAKLFIRTSALNQLGKVLRVHNFKPFKSKGVQRYALKRKQYIEDGGSENVINHPLIPDQSIQEGGEGR